MSRPCYSTHCHRSSPTRSSANCSAHPYNIDRARATTTLTQRIAEAGKSIPAQQPCEEVRRSFSSRCYRQKQHCTSRRPRHRSASARSLHYDSRVHTPSYHGNESRSSEPPMECAVEPQKQRCCLSFSLPFFEEQQRRRHHDMHPLLSMSANSDHDDAAHPAVLSTSSKRSHNSSELRRLFRQLETEAAQALLGHSGHRSTRKVYQALFLQALEDGAAWERQARALAAAVQAHEQREAHLTRQLHRAKQALALLAAYVEGAEHVADLVEREESTHPSRGDGSFSASLPPRPVASAEGKAEAAMMGMPTSDNISAAGSPSSRRLLSWSGVSDLVRGSLGRSLESACHGNSNSSSPSQSDSESSSQYDAHGKGEEALASSPHACVVETTHDLDFTAEGFQQHRRKPEEEEEEEAKVRRDLPKCDSGSSKLAKRTEKSETREDYHKVFCQASYAAEAVPSDQADPPQQLKASKLLCPGASPDLAAEGDALFSSFSRVLSSLTENAAQSGGNEPPALNHRKARKDGRDLNASTQSVTSQTTTAAAAAAAVKPACAMLKKPSSPFILSSAEDANAPGFFVPSGTSGDPFGDVQRETRSAFHTSSASRAVTSEAQAATAATAATTSTPASAAAAAAASDLLQLLRRRNSAPSSVALRKGSVPTDAREVSGNSLLPALAEGESGTQVGLRNARQTARTAEERSIMSPQQQREEPCVFSYQPPRPTTPSLSPSFAVDQMKSVDYEVTVNQGHPERVTRACVPSAKRAATTSKALTPLVSAPAMSSIDSPAGELEEEEEDVHMCLTSIEVSELLPHFAPSFSLPLRTATSNVEQRDTTKTSASRRGEDGVRRSSEPNRSSQVEQRAASAGQQGAAVNSSYSEEWESLDTSNFTEDAD